MSSESKGGDGTKSGAMARVAEGIRGDNSWGAGGIKCSSQTRQGILCLAFCLLVSGVVETPFFTYRNGQLGVAPPVLDLMLKVTVRALFGKTVPELIQQVKNSSVVAGYSWVDSTEKVDKELTAMNPDYTGLGPKRKTEDDVKRRVTVARAQHQIRGPFELGSSGLPVLKHAAMLELLRSCLSGVAGTGKWLKKSRADRYTGVTADNCGDHLNSTDHVGYLMADISKPSQKPSRSTSTSSSFQIYGLGSIHYT